jgi:hypothetical protein
LLVCFTPIKQNRPEGVGAVRKFFKKQIYLIAPVGFRIITTTRSTERALIALLEIMLRSAIFIKFDI